jgi:Family of unknown function (DUF6496)
MSRCSRVTAAGPMPSRRQDPAVFSSIDDQLRSTVMPDKNTLARLHKDKREGKSESTQAGEFVREEIEHIRAGKHGARSTEQAIAIGLSKARRAGVKLPPPPKGTTSEGVREQAARDIRRGKHPERAPNPKRSRAMKKKLKGEGHQIVSSAALSRHARASAKRRTAAERSASARDAVRTKGPSKRSAAAQKAAETRATAD